MERSLFLLFTVGGLRCNLKEDFRELFFLQLKSITKGILHALETTAFHGKSVGE